MFQRLYIVKFAFLLSMVQVAIAVYLSITGINDGEFYNKLFFYSLSLSIVPILFGIAFLSFSNQSNSFISNSNGFVNKNILENGKSSQINETSMHLFALGLLFLCYNLIYSVIPLPNWIIFILPFILAIFILKNKQSLPLLEKE